MKPLYETVVNYSDRLINILSDHTFREKLKIKLKCPLCLLKHNIRIMECSRRFLRCVWHC